MLAARQDAKLWLGFVRWNVGVREQVQRRLPGAGSVDEVVGGVRVRAIRGVEGHREEKKRGLRADNVGADDAGVGIVVGEVIRI